MKFLLSIIFLIISFCGISTESQITEIMKPTIILDAGHGGINPYTGRYVTYGKRSPIWKDGSQYFEGVGNRDIVKRATVLLRSNGFNVRHTVAVNAYHDVPLWKRVRIANKHYINSNRTAFLISVHSNGYKKESANGTEIWTSLGRTKSDKIADIWLGEFSKKFPDIKRRVDTSDGDLDKEAKFTIITDTLCPAILAETMFHTNERECRLLRKESVRQEIAEVICSTAIKAQKII